MKKKFFMGTYVNSEERYNRMKELISEMVDTDEHREEIQKMELTEEQKAKFPDDVFIPLDVDTEEHIVAVLNDPTATVTTDVENLKRFFNFMSEGFLILAFVDEVEDDEE